VEHYYRGHYISGKELLGYYELEPRASEFEVAIQKLRRYISPVVDEF
jgi:hypothetical protein